MKLFAIGDLHLPGGNDKPMNVFGVHWEHHFERISEDWRSRVAPEDVVLIPGDISWAMYLKDAVPDLEAIAALPGIKVMLRGNHDYWWSSVTQVREHLPEDFLALQNDAVGLENVVIAGTRGWKLPDGDEPMEAQDRKILDRELIRLRLSLDAAVKVGKGKPLVVMTHYPPLFDHARDTEMTRVLEDYPVSQVVYGHLHGAGVRAGFNGEHHGIQYSLVSCDALGFRLREIEVPQINRLD